MIEKSADVKLVERIGFRFLRYFFRFFLQKVFVAVIVSLCGLFALFFEHRIGNHFLVDHFPQLKAVQRQHADHLDEAGGQNLLLRDLEVEFESLPSHV